MPFLQIPAQNYRVSQKKGSVFVYTLHLQQRGNVVAWKSRELLQEISCDWKTPRTFTQTPLFLR